MTPRHFTPKVPAGVASVRRAAERRAVEALAVRLKRQRPDGEAGGEPCPVEPDRPLNLSGGAAAALEFDD